METKPASPSNPYAPPAAEPPEKPGATSAPLASLGKRFGGNLIDRLLEFAGGTALSYVVAASTHSVRTTALFFACAAPVYVLQWVLVVVRGQSIGKILLKTRIVRGDDTLPGFGRGVALRAWPLYAVQALQVFLRPVLGQSASLLSFLPLVDAACIFRRGLFRREERRCVHDLIAGTWVVDVSRGE